MRSTATVASAAFPPEMKSSFVTTTGQRDGFLRQKKNLKRFQKVGEPAPVDAGAGQQRRTEVLDKTSVAIDEFESKPEAEEKTCEQCRQPFTPRASSGGKAQRFCSSDCRTAFHNAGSQRVPVTPTYGEPSTKLPHVGNTVATTLAEHLAARAAEEARVSAFWEKNIVVRHQPAIAVYINVEDGLTIRQHREWDEDEDPLVAIGRENISEFVNRVIEICADNGIPIPIRKRTQNGS
jgi:hypothetical protein